MDMLSSLTPAQAQIVLYVCYAAVVALLLPTVTAVSGLLGSALLASLPLIVVWYGISLLRRTLRKKSLKGTLVVMTGAGSGIGRRMSLLFAEKHGTDLALLDINEANLEKVAKEVRRVNKSIRVETYFCNVATKATVDKVFAKIEKDFGHSVDVLVNNAGIVSGKPITELNEEHIRRTYDVNVIAHHWTVKAVLDGMMSSSRPAHIVTIASLAGLNGVASLTDYCGSKFAAVGAHEALRRDLRQSAPGRNIDTTLICPYYINTGMFDGVKTRFPLLLPILDEGDVAERVVSAVVHRDQIVILPWQIGVSNFALRYLPVSTQDWLADVLGVSASMSTFKGRGWQATEESKKSK